MYVKRSSTQQTCFREVLFGTQSERGKRDFRYQIDNNIFRHWSKPNILSKTLPDEAITTVDILLHISDHIILKCGNY